MLVKCSVIIAFLCSSLALAQSDRPVSYDKTGETVMAFDQWLAKRPDQAAALNLYPDFSEPTVEVEDSGIRKSKEIKLMVFYTRAQAVANRPAVNIKLASLITEEAFKKLDPVAKHRRISALQTMPVVAGKRAIANFSWCNKNPANPDIFLPRLEGSQAHMERPGRPWCAADSRTVCFESCRLVPSPSAVEAAIAAYNEIKHQMGKPGKDFGMATQSEARYYVSEAEFGAKFPLSNLTKVSTQVSGILEINIFYVNQIMLYGKMLVIMQADPKDAQKTILTGLTAFAIREHDWNHRVGGGRLQALLRSNSSMNSDTGILAGIPEFSKNAVRGFAEVVEK